MISLTAKPRFNCSTRREALIGNVGTVLGRSAAVIGTGAVGFEDFIATPKPPSTSSSRPWAG